MKKILLAFVTIIFIISLYLGVKAVNEIINSQKQSSAEILGNTVSEPSFKLEYFTSDSGNIYLIRFKPRKIYLQYDSSNKLTARDVSTRENFISSINGGYFLGDRSYAGLLIQDGNLINDLAPNDAQLTGIVILKDSNLQFKEITNFNKDEYTNDVNATVFQAGPYLIKDSVVNTIAIEDSVNGNGKYLRTLMGYTDDGYEFFAITTKIYDLKNLANEILLMNIFKNTKINVMNLDGGTSTFIYSSENPQFSISSFKTLPVILGIK